MMVLTKQGEQAINDGIVLRAARKIKEHQADIAELEEAIESLKYILMDALPDGDSTLGDEETGLLKVSVYQSKQFNEGYGKSRRPDLWEKAAEERLVVTSALAKQKLSEAEYAEFQKPSGSKSVKVEVVNND